MAISPLLNSEMVKYDPKQPGNTYFQEGANQTHLQGGRVYDNIGNQYPPEVKTLWAKRQACPDELRVTLATENRRRKLEAEMAARYEQMKREEEAERAKLQAEIDAIKDREEQKNLRPLDEFSFPAAPGPVGPPPFVFPGEEHLDFLSALVPLNHPAPSDTGQGVVRSISKKIREIDGAAMGFPQMAQ